MAPKPDPNERSRVGSSASQEDSLPPSPQGGSFKNNPETGTASLKPNPNICTNPEINFDSPRSPLDIDAQELSHLIIPAEPIKTFAKQFLYPTFGKKTESNSPKQEIELIPVAYPSLKHLHATPPQEAPITAKAITPSKIDRFDFEVYRSLHNSTCNWIPHYTAELMDIYKEHGYDIQDSDLKKKELSLRHAIEKAIDGLRFLDTQLLNDYKSNTERSPNIRTESILERNKGILDKAARALKVTQSIETNISTAKEEYKKHLTGLKKSYLHELALAAASLNSIGGELLPYDRQRLLGRLLYKPYESYLAFTASGIDSLGKAFPALEATLNTSSYHTFQDIGHGIKKASIWVMLAGLAYMFVDAAIHLIAPFIRKRYVVTDALGQKEVVLEKLEAVQKRRQNWEATLKSKLLERGRWLALAFTVLISTFLIITKVVLNGSFFAINCVHLAGKAIYAAISCGILGYKWTRQKQIIDHLENLGVNNALDRKKELFKIKIARLSINPKKPHRAELKEALERAKKISSDLTKLEALEQVKNSKALQNELNSIKRLEKYTNTPELKALISLDKESNKKQTQEKEDNKKKKVTLGKANFFFLIPTFWVPLGIAWIVRAASKGKKCDFLIAQKTKAERKLEAPSILEPLRIEKRKIAEGLRQKIFCLGIKITLIAGLILTACNNIPSLVIGVTLIVYGLAHGTYEVVRCFTKVKKWKALINEGKHIKEGAANKALICKSLFTGAHSEDEASNQHTALQISKPQPVSAA